MAEQVRKTNMEILNEIRELRNDQLKSLRENSIFVTKVEVLGKGQKTGKEVFRLIEQKEVENKETGEMDKEISELFYEYENGPKLIAMRNPQTQGEIIPIGIDGDEKESWDIQREEIEQCLEERERQVKALAKMLGISEEDINSLSEIDLSQKIDEKMAEDMENDKDEERKEEAQELSEEQMNKVGMKGMNEVNLKSYIDTKGTTLGDVLKLDGYTKIMVVHSYKLAQLTDSEGKEGKHNRMRFGLIAQKSDGTYETIPDTKLKPYRGENRQVTEINDKENVERKREECIFEVPGTKKRVIINQKDPYGIPDIYLAQNTRDNEGQVAQKLQDKYKGTERTDVEVRALFNQNRGMYQADRMDDEAKEHVKAGCDDLDLGEADGREDTGHIHFNPQSPEQQKAIEEIMERGKVSREEAQSKLENELKNTKEDVSLEEATDNAVESIENEYREVDNRSKH